MKKPYHIVTRAARESAAVIEQFCRSNGQILLPIVNMIQSASHVVEGVIHEMGQQTLELILVLSAEQVAGERTPGKAKRSGRTEPLRQRIAVQYHLDGLSREELDAYLTHQLKRAGVSQPLLDETARQALYQATKGILRKVNKLVMTALRLAATRKVSAVNESILLDATTEALL